MKKEIKLWITSVLLNWAFTICPNGKFKHSFAYFLKNNIMDL